MSKSVSEVTFVTYGTHIFKNSKMLLCNEAHQFGFRKFLIGSPENLPDDFLKKHGVFIEQSQRGAGYWLWKPLVVKETLKLLKDDDFLLYADSGCAINPEGKNRFSEWLDMADEHGSLSFQMNHLPEKDWTKMSLAKFMNATHAHMESGQINATVFLIKKNQKNCEMIEEWFDICSQHWTIDDTPSDIPNSSSFKDHRHDQSVFSLLRKKYNSFAIEDETYPAKNHDWSDPSVKFVPVLATRRRF